MTEEGPSARNNGLISVVSPCPLRESVTDLLVSYRQAEAERAALGVPPLPLTAPEVQALIQLLEQPPAGEEVFLLDLLSERIPPGVDEAAYVKASWLSAVAQG